MSQCFKCSLVIDSNKSAACCDCKHYFHPECTKIGSADNLRKMGARRSSWRCEDCKAESSSNASNASKCDLDANQKLFERLETMQRDLSSQIQGVNDNVNDCKTTLSELKIIVDDNKIAINKLESENEARKTQCDILKQDNLELKKELKAVHTQMMELQQYSRRNNLEITGVPFTQGENLVEILQKIADLINVNFHPSDVSVVHRLPTDMRSNGRGNFHPKIIVSFISRTTKERWRYAARGNRFTADHINNYFPATAVYLNDHLTLHNKSILGRARSYVRGRKLAMAWTSDCKILLKKTPGGKIVRAFSIEDVENLVNQPEDQPKDQPSPPNTNSSSTLVSTAPGTLASSSSTNAAPTYSTVTAVTGRKTPQTS